MNEPDSLEEFFADSEVIDFKPEWLKGTNLPQLEMFQRVKAISDKVTVYFTRTPSTDLVSITRLQSGRYQIRSKNLELPSSYMNNFLMVFVFIYRQKCYPSTKESQAFYGKFEEVYKSHANIELKKNHLFATRYKRT